MAFAGAGIRWQGKRSRRTSWRSLYSVQRYDVQVSKDKMAKVRLWVCRLGKVGGKYVAEICKVGKENHPDRNRPKSYKNTSIWIWEREARSRSMGREVRRPDAGVVQEAD